MTYIKRQLSIIAIVLLNLTILSSCGGGGNSNDEGYDKSVELKPNTTEIKGYLGEAFQVVDGSYKFDYTGSKYTGEGKIQVKIKSIGQGDVNDYGLQDGNSGPFYLTVCDASGKPLSDFSDVSSEYKGDDLLKDMLTKEGEENWIPFQINTYQGKKLPDEAATFFVTSKKIEERESSSSSTSSSSSSSNETTASSSGSEDWDKMLDDYEDYVDEYIKFYKKAMNGDQSAMSEYPTLMEKATKLQTSMEKAQSNNELTASQITRMTKIQTKMMNAAMEMQ